MRGGVVGVLCIKIDEFFFFSGKARFVGFYFILLLCALPPTQSPPPSPNSSPIQKFTKKQKQKNSGVHPRVSTLYTTKFSKKKKKKKQWRLHNCGNTTEATTLLQQFIKKKKNQNTCWDFLFCVLCFLSKVNAVVFRLSEYCMTLRTLFFTLSKQQQKMKKKLLSSLLPGLH